MKRKKGCKLMTYEINISPKFHVSEESKLRHKWWSPLLGWACWSHSGANVPFIGDWIYSTLFLSFSLQACHSLSPTEIVSSPSTSVSHFSHPLRLNLRATSVKSSQSFWSQIWSASLSRVVFKRRGPGARSAWVQILITALNRSDCGK